MLLYLNNNNVKNDVKIEELLTPKVRKYLKELGTPSKVIESLIATDGTKDYIKNLALP